MVTSLRALCPDQTVLDVRHAGGAVLRVDHLPLTRLVSASTVIPIERAVPSMIFDRRFDVIGVEVGHLGLGDLAHLVLGDRGDLDLCGSAEPFSIPTALRISFAAGGVLVMKSNERSS